ncbi:MAG: TldD/PmbA family protein [Candidatus Nezhaarchaeota archaeon]|nr:TldD/PmbA family protein [Candidatus Nezhaarchaeota archaeon]MCX8142311.1 TldD/PmbA family protein [Candidatus Nezhaarchaeota archaeon]MDW8050716.1 TldD/PmbA family protein [Nitrososphaerota archaeon]
MELLDICTKLTDRSLKLGADVSEAYGVDLNILKVELEKRNIKSVKMVHDVGVGVRAISKGSTGYSYATSLDIDIDGTAKKAVEAAKAGNPDPDFKDLPRPSSYTRPERTYDGRIASLTPEELIDLCISLAKQAELDKVYSINITVESLVFRRIIVNSNGVEGIEDGTLLYLIAYITAKEGVNLSSGYEGDVVRYLSDLDPERIVMRAAEEAVKGLNAKCYKTMKVPVIFAEKSLSAIIVEGVVKALNADLIQRGRSYLSRRLNANIGPDELTILSDGLIEGGPLTGKFDVEGAPRQRHVLIEHGVVKGLLHNSYTAGKAGVESTGNATRSGGDLDFRGQVVIAPSNVVVEAGNWSLQEMIQEVDNGLLILDTHDIPNIATGDFSAMVTHGYIIEKGEVTLPIKQTLFAINLLDLARKIRAVGKERAKYFNLYSPPLLVLDVQVSSKA